MSGLKKRLQIIQLGSICNDSDGDITITVADTSTDWQMLATDTLVLRNILYYIENTYYR